MLPPQCFTVGKVFPGLTIVVDSSTFSISIAGQKTHTHTKTAKQRKTYEIQDFVCTLVNIMFKSGETKQHQNIQTLANIEALAMDHSTNRHLPKIMG